MTLTLLLFFALQNNIAAGDRVLVSFVDAQGRDDVGTQEAQLLLEHIFQSRNALAIGEEEDATSTAEPVPQPGQLLLRFWRVA